MFIHLLLQLEKYYNLMCNWVVHVLLYLLYYICILNIMRLNLENNFKTSMSIYVLKYVINLWYNNVQYFAVFFFYCFVKSLIKNTEITHVPIIQKKPAVNISSSGVSVSVWYIWAYIIIIIYLHCLIIYYYP